VGQQANFTVDAFPTTTFQGNVTQIRQAPINVQNVITYDVVVGVSNADLRLLPGMTANVKILTSEVANVLKIPNAALRFHPVDLKPPATVHAASGRKNRQDGGSTIWILGQDGKPKPVRVKLGITDGLYTAVQAGDLKPGDPIITGSLTKLPSGTAPARAQGPGAGPRF
jgi:HlyD family secretion protein